MHMHGLFLVNVIVGFNYLITGSDEVQRTSAKYMHRSLILRNGLCYVSFLMGSLAAYQQNLVLYLVFTVLNGLLGFLIFFFHCTSNEHVLFKLSIYKIILRN
jgi:hypothetical protein